MSIHFRSRISGQRNLPTVVGDSNSGWCCGGGKDSTTTRVVCENAGGYFLSGAFNGNDCPGHIGCSSGLAAPNSGACCRWSKENGTYNQICSQTETQLECINENEGGEEGLGYSFYSGLKCGNIGGTIMCNGVDITKETKNNPCNPNDEMGCYNPNDILGTCCSRNADASVSCSITAKRNCFGYWSQPVDGIWSCVDLSPCSGVHYAGLSAGETPARANLSVLTNSTNPIETLPTIGSLYQGGLYVGTFVPGAPINELGSLVYGNRITGKASDYRVSGIGLGTKEKSWILISSVADFGNYAYNILNEETKIITTSNYDGLFNTYNPTISEDNTLISLIKKYKINGFDDWYLPSQDELAFYFKNIPFDFNLYGFSPPKNNQYMSSTVYSLNGKQEFSDKSFVIAQMADEVNYGRTNIVYRKTSMAIRLFRRIYLDS